MTTQRLDPQRLERNWRAITIELDAPRAGRTERMLRRAGVPAHVARVALATPALRRAWLVAIGFVVFAGLAATDADRPRDDLFVLLVLAPLVPLLGVAWSFGPDSDPSHEVTLSTPMRGLRLVITRAVTVLTASTAMLGVAALAAPGRSLAAFAWVVPSLGLCAAALAAMTYLSPRRAGAAVAGAWIVAVTVIRNNAADPLAAFTAPGQLVLFGVALAAAALVYRRRDRFDLLVSSW